MRFAFTKSQIAFAAVAAIGVTAIGTATTVASASDRGKKDRGTYVTGDFHNHTTCSDGSISMQKLIKKSTDTVETPWGLDWFVQAGHGGNGNRNCTLTEDESLSTPGYPFLPGQGPTTTWAASIGTANVRGNTASADATSTTPLSTQANPAMWRWQSIQEYQYPLAEYLSALKGVPVFTGVESVVAGHEHTSMSVITGQLPNSIYSRNLPRTAGYKPRGDANALAQWTYCFDRGDTDNSRGGGQGWDCSVTGSLNAGDPSWNPTAAKLVPTGTTGVGVKGHLKTVEAVKWMAQNHPKGSYYVPAHLERAGPFNPDGNNGYNIEHLRNFNNAAPKVAFGFETQPGHGASANRGEYQPNRNSIGGVLVDSVGGTTYGGTGVYGAQVGGVWDALLGEGRSFWFFASSDWHNRGIFGPDDRRSTQDFFPGEYQRDFVMVRTADNKNRRDDRDDDKGRGRGRDDERRDRKDDDKLSPQAIVDGLRTGNSFAASGQLIDRLAFVACATYPPSRPTPVRDAAAMAVVETVALIAAANNTDVDRDDCATMGEKLVVRPGAEIIVSIVVRDPSGKSFSPYSFANPSLKQIGVTQPLDKPVLDHIDVIGGLVSGYKNPNDAASYAGEWPRTWLTNPDMSTVPVAAKNTTASVIKTFNAGSWKSIGNDFRKMSFRIPKVQESRYLRLRGTNMPASVPSETDANGNPLADLFTNAGNTANLSIPCNDAACPDHMAVKTTGGPKFASYDVAAWADLWFYSNPIYIEVRGSTKVAGVE